MDDDAALVLGLLRARGETLATCESLTGGMVGAALTSVPGASDVYRGGLIAYSVGLKGALASVPGRLIDEHGVVSAEVAVAMAQGARASCEADWCVSTTGVAGPGSSDGVRAGTVWVAVAGPAGETARPLQVAGGREDVRRASVAAALGLLAEVVGGASRE